MNCMTPALSTRIGFRVQRQIFLSVFKNISAYTIAFSPVHTNTQLQFENDKSLFWQQSYLTKHLYVLV